MSRCATSPRATWRKRNGCASSSGCRKACASPRFVADVSDEAQVLRFRDAVAEQQETDKIHLLFNNAGIGGGGSMIANDRERMGEDVQHLLGRRLPQHARVPADAAEGGRGAHRQHQQRQRVLGLGRAAHAAHRVCGGEVRGEGIFRGADHRSADQRAAHQGLGRDARPYRHVDRRQLAQDPGRQRIRTRSARRKSRRRGRGSRRRARIASALSDDEIRAMLEERARRFLEEAPTTAAQAATIILDGVKADRWRILVGEDAHRSSKAGARSRRNTRTTSTSSKASPPRPAGDWAVENAGPDAADRGDAAAIPPRHRSARPRRKCIFSCGTGAKVVSVCAAGELSAGAGSLNYRFGPAGKPEMIYPPSELVAFRGALRRVDRFPAAAAHGWRFIATRSAISSTPRSAAAGVRNPVSPSSKTARWSPISPAAASRCFRTGARLFQQRRHPGRRQAVRPALT